VDPDLLSHYFQHLTGAILLMPLIGVLLAMGNADFHPWPVYRPPQQEIYANVLFLLHVIVAFWYLFR
jgi:hypothetical protein